MPQILHPHPLLHAARRRARPWALAGLCALAAMSAMSAMSAVQALPPAQAATSTATANSAAVAWLNAAADADIDKAFALAKAENKPLLLYWGAAWCPPCNHLKATLFNRVDFIERTRSLVAVNIDGDLPGAQKLGARFKVRGYPTLILMRPDGAEITRLPGEADAPQVLAALQLGLSGGRPAQAVLADARAGKPISGAEWRMLAFYAWDTDEAQLVNANDRPALLVQLSAAAPASEASAATRLLLKALADSDDGKGLRADAALRQRVARLLADAKASRAQADVLVNASSNIAKALAPEGGAQRREVVAGFDTALQRLQADASLSRADRLNALGSRVLLARIDSPKTERHPKLPAPLLQQVRAQVGRDDAEIRDPYERQNVITTGAAVMGDAGLWADSDQLLKANLARSQSPYYLMSQLGSNARKQGRTDEALQWYEKAYARSEGPATRLQWGETLVRVLTELAPQDATRIEQVARQMFAEAGKDPAAFHERSARSLQRTAKRLAEWARTSLNDAVLQRLQAGPDGLTSLCGKLDAADPQRSTCDGVLKTLALAAKA